MQKEYADSVVEEMERVLHPQGALIQYDSNFNLDKNLFERHPVDPELAEKLSLDWRLEKYQPKT